MTDVSEPGGIADLSVQKPVFWIGADEVDAKVANQFTISRDEEEGDFILTIGFASMPMLTGTPDQMREQAERVPYVPIRTLGKYGMSQFRLRQLAGLFKTMVDRIDELERGRGSGADA